MISFSAGCVINLDDLDDFPDYFQVITNLLTSLEQTKIDYKSMETLLDADLQDIQHIPEFKPLLSSLINRCSEIFTEDRKQMKYKFIVLMLKIIKNYFTSFTMEEEQAAPIMTLLLKELPNQTQLFCDFWLSISKFAPYVENHKELVELYLKVVNQRDIFRSETMSLAYVKSVDKILRFRMFRQAFQIIMNGNHHESQMVEDESKQKLTPFLKYKLSQYQIKESAHIYFQEFINFISKNQQSSSYIVKYIEAKKQQLK